MAGRRRFAIAGSTDVKSRFGRLRGWRLGLFRSAIPALVKLLLDLFAALGTFPRRLRWRFPANGMLVFMLAIFRDDRLGPRQVRLVHPHCLLYTSDAADDLLCV